MAGRRLRCLVVDDEPLARDLLRTLVGEDGRLELVGEAEDGRRALDLFRELEPDILFLDIRMPGASGVDVARAVAQRAHVVFTTAFEDYAVTAFELQAVDYLLKPFTRSRFQHAVDRILEQESAAQPDQIERALNAEKVMTTLTVRSRRGYQMLRVADVERFEAADDYARVHAAGSSYLISVRMHELEERLPEAVFIRVHRSHLVNLRFARTLVPVGSGRGELTMKDGTTIPVSRSGMAAVRPILKNIDL